MTAYTAKQIAIVFVGSLQCFHLQNMIILSRHCTVDQSTLTGSGALPCGPILSWWLIPSPVYQHTVTAVARGDELQFIIHWGLPQARHGCDRDMMKCHSRGSTLSRFIPQFKWRVVVSASSEKTTDHKLGIGRLLLVKSWRAVNAHIQTYEHIVFIVLFCMQRPMGRIRIYWMSKAHFLLAMCSLGSMSCAQKIHVIGIYSRDQSKPSWVNVYQWNSRTW